MAQPGTIGGCVFESCRAYHLWWRWVGSIGGFDERGVRVCNGLGHNVARVGTVWHNLAQRFGVVAARILRVLLGDGRAKKAVEVGSGELQPAA